VWPWGAIALSAVALLVAVELACWLLTPIVNWINNQ